MHFLEYIHPETNPPRDSVAIVIGVTGSKRSPRFLVAERLLGFRKGERTFFGGGIEPGERPKRAAIREAKEESGLRFTEFDLIPAQRNPSIERWQGSFHKVYKYYAFVDRRKSKPQRVEEDKLSEWQAISEKELFSLIRDLKMPDFVLRGSWRHTLRDIRYD